MVRQSLTHTVTFCVPGEPVAQPRVRHSSRGGFSRAYVPAKHPIHAFRQAVAMAAKAAGVRQASESVLIFIDAVFERPKSHWNSRGLAASAPPRPRPDVDNIQKGIQDALKGIAYGDDSQIIRGDVTKRYAARGEQGKTEITICADADLDWILSAFRGLRASLIGGTYAQATPEHALADSARGGNHQNAHCRRCD